jgi:hypothetical protein
MSAPLDARMTDLLCHCEPRLVRAWQSPVQNREGRPNLSGFVPQRIMVRKVIESPDISELSMAKEESSAI